MSHPTAVAVGFGTRQPRLPFFMSSSGIIGA